MSRSACRVGHVSNLDQSPDSSPSPFPFRIRTHVLALVLVSDPRVGPLVTHSLHLLLVVSHDFHSVSSLIPSLSWIDHHSLAMHTRDLTRYSSDMILVVAHRISPSSYGTTSASDHSSIESSKPGGGRRKAGMEGNIPGNKQYVIDETFDVSSLVRSDLHNLHYRVASGPYDVHQDYYRECQPPSPSAIFPSHRG